jgi:hypothetical protein
MRADQFARPHPRLFRVDLIDFPDDTQQAKETLSNAFKT